MGYFKLIDCIRLRLKYFSFSNESGSNPSSNASFSSSIASFIECFAEKPSSSWNLTEEIWYDLLSSVSDKTTFTSSPITSFTVFASSRTV